MVGRGAGTVRLEVIPWLTQAFGVKGSSRLVLEEEITGESTLADFLVALAAKHDALGKTIVDPETGRLFEHVSVICNEVMLNPDVAPQQTVRGGDTLVLLPAYAGG